MTQETLDLTIIDTPMPTHPDLDGAVVNMPKAEPVAVDVEGESMPMEDERGGLPSASSLSRIVSCPGSWALERGLSDVAGSEAERGTRIHSWLEWDMLGQKGDEPKLEAEDEYEMASSCQGILLKVVSDLFGNALEVFMAEKRLWMTDEMLGDRLMSGAADVVFVSPDRKRYLIADYKTGRVAAEPEECNKQLMALAVLLDEHLDNGGYAPPEVIYGVIVQPMVTHKPQLVEYSADDVVRARAYIEQALLTATAHGSDAPLNPSKSACNYCKARATCPALRGEIEVAQQTSIDRVCWESLDAPAKLKAYDMACLAERWAGMVKSKCKGDLEAGLTIDGLQLKEGNKVRSVTDVGEAYQLLSGTLSADAFIRACSVKISALESEYYKVEQAKDEAAGVKKRTQSILKDELSNLLGSCIGAKQNKPSVERSNA